MSLGKIQTLTGHSVQLTSQPSVKHLTDSYQTQLSQPCTNTADSYCTCFTNKNSDVFVLATLKFLEELACQVCIKPGELLLQLPTVTATTTTPIQ